MNLFTKIMPVFQHYVCTGFGMSERAYGEEKQQMAGTGEGNKFLGDICRDISYLIIRELKKRMLGVKFKSVISNEIEQCVAVSFVDDNDLAIDSENVEVIMQEIIDLYEMLHAAIGGEIEGSKTKYFAWQWKIK
jgi:hypothetical protein